VQLFDGFGISAQQLRGPQRAGDIVTSSLQLGRQTAVQNHQFVVEPSVQGHDEFSGLLNLSSGTAENPRAGGSIPPLTTTPVSRRPDL
jgi:hypothetical protein